MVFTKTVLHSLFLEVWPLVFEAFFEKNSSFTFRFWDLFFAILRGRVPCRSTWKTLSVKLIWNKFTAFWSILATYFRYFEKNTDFQSELSLKSQFWPGKIFFSNYSHNGFERFFRTPTRGLWIFSPRQKFEEHRAHNLLCEELEVSLKSRFLLQKLFFWNLKN